MQYLTPVIGYTGYANAPKCYVCTYITRLVLNEFKVMPPYRSWYIFRE